jgi:hypothetical protein
MLIGKVFERTLDRLSPEDQIRFFAKTSPPAPLRLKVLEGNVGYVALDSFGDQKLVKEFDDLETVLALNASYRV